MWFVNTQLLRQTDQSHTSVASCVSVCIFQRSMCVRVCMYYDMMSRARCMIIMCLLVGSTSKHFSDPCHHPILSLKGSPRGSLSHEAATQASHWLANGMGNWSSMVSKTNECQLPWDLYEPFWHKFANLLKNLDTTNRSYSDSDFIACARSVIAKIIEHPIHSIACHKLMYKLKLIILLKL